MAGLTENGYDIKRFRDLVDDVQQSLIDNDSKIVITDSSNKVVNNIVNPLLLAIAEAWELGQELYDSFDIDSASGIALDRLAEFKDTKRLEEDYSTGNIEFRQNSAGNVNENVTVRTTTGQTLFSLENRQLNQTLVNSFTITYTNQPAIEGAVYFLNLGSETFNYTAEAGNTLDDVYSVLKVQIDNTGRFQTIVSSGSFYVKGIANINFSLGKRSDMTVSEFSTLVLFRTSIVGDVIVTADTATSLLSSVSGNISVNNPRNFDRGNLEETDEELRQRLKNVTSVTGKSVPESILRGVSDVNGVDSVTLEINNSIFTSENDNPPKSYEVIVIGGDDQDIADAILSYGGAGIRSFGNVSLLSEGKYGGLYPISFTRPDNSYIFLKVEYERYEEFDNFPSNGEELIRTALVEAGSSYQPDQDVVPSALNSVVYNTVSGVGELRITAGYSLNSADTAPVDGYSENRVSVGSRNIATITPERVIVVETTIT